MTCSSIASATPPPNFVFVLLDDMAWSGSSVQMDPNDPNSKSDYHQTPVLEQLAAQGMVFTNSYSAGPMCSPSRAAIMTGKSAAQLQVTDVRHAGNYREVQFQNFYQGFPLTPPQPRNHFPEETTIMDALKESTPTYRGGYFGKYDWQPNMPWEKWDRYDDLAFWQHTPEDPIAMFTNTNNAMTFMQDQVNANRPFFTYVSHDATKWDNNPTLRSLQSTRDYFATQPVGTKHNNPAYAAMYKDVDTTIGLLLDKIDALGIANNTYVIFSSDNGASTDLGNSIINAPLFDGKGSLYEGGIRAPLIVRGPGVAPGTYSDVPVTSADLYSTFLDLAGRTLPLPAGVEGTSLKPILTNAGDLPAGQSSLQRPFGPNGELFFHYPHYNGNLVDDGGGNYHYNPISPTNAIPTPESAIIDGDFKLIRYYGERGGPDKYLLFNLAQNQLESSDINSPLNLASQFPEKVQQMEAKLDAWLQGVDASLPYDVSAPVDLMWNAGAPGTTLLPNSAARIWRTVNDVDSLAREEWYAHGSRTQGPIGSPPPASLAANRPTRVAASPHQPGLPQHAYDFDGDDGFSHAFFLVSDARRPALFDADHSATIETWVRFDSLTTEQLLFESGSAAQGLSLTVGDADGDAVADEVRFRVRGKLGNELTVTAEFDKFADPTRDFIHVAAVVGDAPTNRYIELFVNGASMGRVNAAPGGASLDWDGYDSASMGRLGLGEFNVDTVGGASGTGPLPFTNGNLRGDVATFRFLNTAQSTSAIRDHYNAALYPAALGIQSLAGAASTPSARPSNVSAGAFESTGMQVFQERNDVLSSPLTVDAVVSGAANFYAPGTGSSQLPVGTDFTSYLLHFDPAGAATGELRTVTGSVTFIEEIIGLVTGNALMVATDPNVGAVGDYGTTARGISWASGDYLTVSSDQKTLSFQLSTLSDQLLQFRVLTDLTTTLVPGATPGDFNDDGFVDAADLGVWRAAVGVNSQGDADGDGDTDGADFLTWQRMVVSPSPADFHADGVVNGQDLAQWQGSFGANGGADCEGDGDSDGADFLMWQRDLRPAALGAANAVPEASGVALLSLGWLCVGGAFRRAAGRRIASARLG